MFARHGSFVFCRRKAVHQAKKICSRVVCWTDFFIRISLKTNFTFYRFLSANAMKISIAGKFSKFKFRRKTMYL